MAAYRDVLALPRHREVVQAAAAGEGGIVTGFISACLYVFAGCAALGLIPAAVLAARAGQRKLTVVPVLVAVFVIWVLCTAAGDPHA